MRLAHPAAMARAVFGLIPMPHAAGVIACLVLTAIATPARADVSLNNMFGDHMVLQQGIKNKVWGKADPGEAVTVTLGSQTHSATAGADGMWHVFLDPVRAYGGPHTLTVKGKNTVTFNDVLIGEVWVCAGQSNMQWSINQSNDPDLEKAAAKFPNIRLISVPQVGTQEPQTNFNGQWAVCSPETVGGFSAVGYLFGRQLHETLGVPVGLINNAWGGSAAEAWVNRDKLAANDKLKPLHERWVKTEEGFKAAQTEYEKQLAEWKTAAEKAKDKEAAPPKSESARRQSPAAKITYNSSHLAIVLS